MGTDLARSATVIGSDRGGWHGPGSFKLKTCLYAFSQVRSGVIWGILVINLIRSVVITLLYRSGQLYLYILILEVAYPEGLETFVHR